MNGYRRSVLLLGAGGLLALAVVIMGGTATTPPSLVGAALTAVLLVLTVRPTDRLRRQELDAALVAAVGLAMLAASAAAGWAPALPLAACTGLLVAALWHRQRASADREPARPQLRVPRSVVATTAAVGALGMLALPTTGAVGLRSTLFGRHHVGGQSAEAPYLDPAGFSTDTLSLDVRGRLSTTPLVAVTADASTLWRGNVYVSYDGHHWRTPAGHPADGPTPTVTGEGPSTEPVAPSPLDPRPPGAPVRVVAVPLTASFSGLYAPGVVIAVAAPGRLVHRSPAGASFAPYRGGSAAYAAQVVLPVTDAVRLDAARGADPAGWTGLPAGLPARVRDLANAITARPQTRAGKVAAVESYLRSHERYTLDAPVPAAGRDSVEAFLFADHEGFCEQFASAETVLLRSVGIPARLATGFAYGAPGTDSESGRRVFTAADAHAWVEVSYPGLGWSPSDPTAGASLVGPARSIAAQVRAFVASVGRSPLRRAGAASVLGVLAVGVTLLAARGRRRLAARRRDRASGPVSTAFARLERRLPRAPEATPREYVATLPADLTHALSAWEAELFGCGAGDDDVRSAVRAVHNHRRQALHRRRFRPSPVALLVPFVAVAATIGRPPPQLPLRAAPCIGTSCLEALAASSQTTVLGPGGAGGAAVANPTTFSGQLDYQIDGPAAPSVPVSSRPVTRRAVVGGSAVSPVTVRGRAGLARYDAPPGTHALGWTEAGRQWWVSFPIEIIPAAAATQLSGWVTYPPAG